MHCGRNDRKAVTIIPLLARLCSHPHLLYLPPHPSASATKTVFCHKKTAAVAEHQSIGFHPTHSNRERFSHCVTDGSDIVTWVRSETCAHKWSVQRVFLYHHHRLHSAATDLPSTCCHLRALFDSYDRTVVLLLTWLSKLHAMNEVFSYVEVSVRLPMNFKWTWRRLLSPYLLCLRMWCSLRNHASSRYRLFKLWVILEFLDLQIRGFFLLDYFFWHCVWVSLTLLKFSN